MSFFRFGPFPVGIFVCLFGFGCFFFFFFCVFCFWRLVFDFFFFVLFVCFVFGLSKDLSVVVVFCLFVCLFVFRSFFIRLSSSRPLLLFSKNKNSPPTRFYHPSL